MRSDGMGTYQARPCDRLLRIELCEGSGRVEPRGIRVQSQRDSGSASGVSGVRVKESKATTDL
jgi:hypothetical protein